MYRSSVVKEDTHVYYNISIVNNTNQSIPAVFSETRTDPIVEDPSEYHLAVAAFNIPTYIPIFTFQPNTYSVTLQYQGVSIQTYVNNLITPSATFPILTQVTNYQQFLDQINLAFKESYDLLVGLITPPATAPVPSPPFLVFDSDTQIFTLVAHWQYLTYSQSGLNNTFYIYMNSTLASFFPGMQTVVWGEGLANGLDTQFIITQNSNKLSWGVSFNNGYFPPQTYEVPQSPYIPGNLVATFPMEDPTTPIFKYLPPTQPILAPLILTTYSAYQPYFVNSQMFPQTSAWYSPRTLQLVTTLLPIAKEAIPGVNNQRAILTDFNFPLYNNIATVIGYTQYTPSLYRLIDLNSTEAIKQADLYVYYTDNVSDITQLYIPPYNELTVKLVFIKKTPVYNPS